MSDRTNAAIDFGKLAAEVIREELHADLKARLDAQGADAFELAAADVESWSARLLVAEPGMSGRQMAMRLAHRLRAVAITLRKG